MRKTTASSKGNCMAKQSSKDKKMEVVSANIGRKRKQKKDKLTLELRN